jgi:maltooligosyltrehalose trehalohydrolase
VNRDLAKVGAALALLSPYVPLVFQGEEWGASAPFQFFVDFHSEPDLAAAVRQGRQREFAAFGWDQNAIPDPNEAATFERSKLNWNELDAPPHRDMLDWYRTLIAFRRHPSFRDTRLQEPRVRFDEQRQWLVTERGGLVLIANFSADAQDIPLSCAEPHHVALSLKPPVLKNNAIQSAPQSVSVLLKNGAT